LNSVAGQSRDEGELDDPVANSEVLCPLCSAPLADDEVQRALSSTTKALAGVCDSCRHQVFDLYDDGASNLRIAALLPKRMRQSMELTGKACEVAGQALGPSPPAFEVRRFITSLLDA
jgi:hypothetical protein